MKNKHRKDRFNTRCWYYNSITDPYQVIAQLFSQAGIDDFRVFVGRLLYYAGEEKIYRDHPPRDVLLYMQCIRSLMLAAHELKERRSSILVTEGDLMNPKYYRSHYSSSGEWSDLPRCLSKKEFGDPYRVFRQFFVFLPLQQWIHYWEKLVGSALSRSRGGHGINIIATYFLLVKLLEAAHLVDVREVTHVGGVLKDRLQKQ